jgi:hypothetical protein
VFAVGDCASPQGPASSVGMVVRYSPDGRSLNPLGFRASLVAAARTPDGGVVVAGRLRNDTSGLSDWYIAGVSRDGARVLWELTRAGGAVGDGATAVAVQKNGLVWVAGTRTIAGRAVVELARCSPGGVLQRVVDAYSSAIVAQAAALRVDGAGDAVVTGHLTRPAGDDDMITVKASADGAVVWRDVLDGRAAGAAARGVDARIHGDGSVYVTGFAANAAGTDYVVLRRLSAAGRRSWTRYLVYKTGTTEWGLSERPSALALDGRGNAVVCGQFGHHEDGGFTASLAFIARWTAAGKRDWLRVERPWGRADMAAFNDVISDPAGRVYCCGFEEWPDAHHEGDPPGHGPMDVLVAAYSPAGKRLWLQEWDCQSLGLDERASVLVTSGSSLYVAGYALDDRALLQRYRR